MIRGEVRQVPLDPSIYRDPLLYVDNTRQKDLCRAVALLALCILLYALMTSFGDYESIGFKASLGITGGIILISVIARIYYGCTETKYSKHLRDTMVNDIRVEMMWQPNASPDAICNEKFEDLQRQLLSSNWLDRDVIYQADKVMKLSYAVVCLKLEELVRTQKVPDAAFNDVLTKFRDLYRQSGAVGPAKWKSLYYDIEERIKAYLPNLQR